MSLAATATNDHSGTSGMMPVNAVSALFPFAAHGVTHEVTHTHLTTSHPETAHRHDNSWTEDNDRRTNFMIDLRNHLAKLARRAMNSLKAMRPGFGRRGRSKAPLEIDYTHSGDRTGIAAATAGLEHLNLGD
jgi:hypothetical protein